MRFLLHRQALMKALDDTYVPVGTRNDNVESMINKLFEGIRLTFVTKIYPLMGCRTTRHCM